MMSGGEHLGAKPMRPSEPREWPAGRPVRRDRVPPVPERVTEGQLQRDPVLGQIKKDFLDTLDDPITRDWFQYAQHIFPSGKVKRVGDALTHHAENTLHLSVLFANLGNVQRLSRVEGRMVKDPRLNLLVQFWGKLCSDRDFMRSRWSF